MQTPDQHNAPETKALGSDITGAFDEFMHAFEDFKDANDDRLNQLEKRMSADVVTSDKVDRISRAMDQLSQKQSRPPHNGQSSARRV